MKDMLIVNKEVNKGMLETKEEFNLWCNQRYQATDNLEDPDPYDLYTNACALSAHNDTIKALLLEGLLSPFGVVLVALNDRVLLVHSGSIKGESYDGAEALYDITEELRDELVAYGVSKGEFKGMLKGNQTAAGDVVSKALFGYSGGVRFKPIMPCRSVLVA